MNPKTLHWLVIIGTVLIPVLGGLWMRRRGHTLRIRSVCLVLAALLTLNALLYFTHQWTALADPWKHALPMQLCDWVLVVTILALLRKDQYYFDLAYFWGMSGTLQAVITPGMKLTWTDPKVWSFMITHSGIVAGILFLLAAGRRRITLSSLKNVLVASQIYILCALAINSLTGANYGFLSHKPVTLTLLSFLSDNPYVYVLQMEMLALLFFGALFLPFIVLHRIRAVQRGYVPTNQSPLNPTADRIVPSHDHSLLSPSLKSDRKRIRP